MGLIPNASSTPSTAVRTTRGPREANLHAPSAVLDNDGHLVPAGALGCPHVAMDVGFEAVRGRAQRPPPETDEALFAFVIGLVLAAPGLVSDC
jgi:hypothetical protein